jgi:hypothetical protein
MKGVKTIKKINKQSTAASTYLCHYRIKLKEKNRLERN